MTSVDHCHCVVSIHIQPAEGGEVEEQRAAPCPSCVQQFPRFAAADCFLCLAVLVEHCVGMSELCPAAMYQCINGRAAEELPTAAHRATAAFGTPPPSTLLFSPRQM